MRSWPKALFWIVLGSAALKLLLIGLLTGMPCSHDQCDYIDLATRLAAGQGLQVHDGYLWPPGFIALLAACRILAGDGLTLPRLLQALASTATIPFVFAIGRRMYGARAGLAAAALFAFDPTLVAFTHYLWPETLYLALFIPAFWLILTSAETGSNLPRIALGGLLLGLAALVKGVALYVAPMAMIWLILEARRQPDSKARGALALLLPAVLLAGATLVPILPWTLRNWVVLDRFPVLEATAGRNLYIGTNLPPPSNWDLGFDERRRVHGGRPRCTEPNVVDADRCERHNAWQFIREHPGLMLSRIPLKLADLLNPSSFLIRHARLGKYPHPFSASEARLLTLLTSGTWMVTAALGLAGLVLIPRVRGRGLVMAILGYHLAVHAVTFGMTRFRLPMVPLLMLAAGPLLAHSWRRLPGFGANAADQRAGLPSGWRLGAALLGVAVLVLLWSMRWETVFDLFRPGSPVNLPAPPPVAGL